MGNKPSRTGRESVVSALETDSATPIDPQDMDNMYATLSSSGRNTLYDKLEKNPCFLYRSTDVARYAAWNPRDIKVKFYKFYIELKQSNSYTGVPLSRLFMDLATELAPLYHGKLVIRYYNLLVGLATPILKEILKENNIKVSGPLILAPSAPAPENNIKVSASSEDDSTSPAGQSGGKRRTYRKVHRESRKARKVHRNKTQRRSA
jgi:hypothetical protein